MREPMPLQKLMIRGIRAFSPVSQNVIEFATPFTLIVGANGAGKTTIIESLKYALTGLLPPNSKGGAFIYDPKMLREPDVRAEIRLKFTDSKDNVLTVKRVLQALQRGGKLSQKTLETELVRETSEEGGTTSIMASKLGDVDSIVPSLVGASASLIEFVILCHQEDGSWPISEPRVVKERLDAIFCSTEYTKALKAMKDSKREVQSEIRVLDERLIQLNSEKSRKSELTTRLEKMTGDSASLSRKLSVLEAEKDRLRSVVATLRRDEELYAQLEKNYRALMSEFDGCLNFIKNFRHEVIEDELRYIQEIVCFIEDVPDPLTLHAIREALAKQITRYRPASLSKLENYQHGVEQCINGLESSIALSNRARILIEGLERLNTASANLKSQSATVEERDEITAITRKQEIEESLAKHSLLKKRLLEFEKLNREIILRYSKDKADVSENVTNRREGNGNELKDSSAFRSTEDISKPDEMDITEQLELITDEVNEIEMQISENIENLYLKQKMADEQAAIDGEIDLKENELKQLTNDTEQRENLEVARNLLKTKMDTAAQISGKIQTELANIKKIALNVKSKSISNAELIAILERAEASRNNPCAAIEVIKELESWIEQAPCLRHDTSAIKSFTEQINALTKQAAISTNAEAIYKNFKDIANSKRECPLCKHALPSDKLELFNKKLSNVIIKLPIKAAEIQSQIQALDYRRSRANEEMQEILEEKEHLDSILGQIRLLISHIMEQQTVLACSSTERLHKEYDTISKRIYRIDAAHERIDELQKELRQLNEIKECAGRQSLQPNDGLEALKNRINQLKETKSQLALKIEDLKRQREIAKERAAIQFWLTENQKLSKINTLTLSKELEEVNNSIILISQMKAEQNVRDKQIEQIEEESVRIKGNLVAIHASLSQAVSNLSDTFLSNLKTCQNECLMQDERLLQHAQALNSLFTDPKPPSEMNTNTLTEFEAHFLQNIQALKTLKEEIQAAKQDAIARIESVQRMKDHVILLDENIKLRSCKERVLKIEAEFGDFDMKKRAQLSERIEHYRTKESTTASKAAMIAGELKQNDLNIKDLKNDLKNNYEETNKRYARAALELRAYELSIKEIDICIHSLDRAIVEYHQAKLEEVNAVLHDLWSSTYRGGDIETIELRSDSSDLRSCGYSIVMIKEGVAVDMRGRCSAGQRAIACILVRIALADSFSSGCNILALDEPTTNLDRANVISLAGMLTSLIKKRRGMQLIVITHDEEFVGMIECEELECFYRVKRSLRGDSHIERHTVNSSNLIA